MLRHLSTSHLVSIAQIKGRVGGVGSEFILACDMRFAARGSAIFSQFEPSFGVIPGAGGAQHLTRLMGRRRALEVMLSAEDYALATLKLVAAKVSSMNILYLLSFLGGAAMVLGLSSLGGKTSQHVFELRIYHVNEGKLQALKDRFGDHTDAIFKRHNMKSIGYWVPEDAPGSQNLFIYILEHPSREEAKKNWAEFQADAEWKKVKADSEIQGPLANHIDSYFMDPTSFSALK